MACAPGAQPGRLTSELTCRLSAEPAGLCTASDSSATLAEGASVNTQPLLQALVL